MKTPPFHGKNMVFIKLYYIERLKNNFFIFLLKEVRNVQVAANAFIMTNGDYLTSWQKPVGPIKRHE